jgi:two-component system sensor histidine kinase AtoS
MFSVVPIIAIGTAYHAFLSDIVSQTAIRQLENDLQLARNNVRSVLNSFDLRLQSIADLSDLNWIDLHRADASLSPTVQTIFDFELDSPDLYAIGLVDARGEEVLVVPGSSRSELGLGRAALPVSQWQDLVLIGPSEGLDGRPGWVGLQRQTRTEASPVRAVILWLRLASLTEASKSIDRVGLSRPVLWTPNGRFDITGSPIRTNPEILVRSEIVPGWELEVVLTGEPAEPLGHFRWVLLFAVMVSGLAIAIVFGRLSRKLNADIAPLVEGAKRVSKGELSIRVPETTGGEIGMLARAFNEMGDSLRQTVRSNVEIERRALLGEISAGIAHEVLNPMTSIRASVQGMARDPSPDAADVQAVSGVVLEEVDRVTDLMTSFLAFARPREPSPEVVSLRHATERALALIHTAAGDAHVEVRNAIPERLKARVDPIHYRQILMNLLLNAIDACATDARVEIGARIAKGRRIEVTVTDNGSGMTAEVAENALKPFFTTKPGGTGLGLAISAELAQSNGGSLAVTASAGKGTSIVVSLPSAMGGKKDGSDTVTGD